jgi:hypothetical protein
MGSSSMITLFSEPPQSSWFPSTFLISAIVHAGLCSLLSIRAIENHRIIESFPPSRFSVKVVDFRSPQPQTQRASGGGIPYPGPSASPSAAHKLASGGAPAGSPAPSRQTAQLMPAPQTLIQPDLPHERVMPPKIAVPLVVLWTPDKVEPKKRIVPPIPTPAAIAVVHPSLDIPIKEENLADLRISSSAFVTQSPAAPPSTTSPIVVHGPEEVKKVPQTTSKQPDPPVPTPARVISLSDIRVAQGSVAIPMVNETSPKAAPGSLVPGQLKDPRPVGTGDATSKNSDAGAGKGAGEHVGKQNDRAAASGNGAAHGQNGDQAGKDGKAASGQGQNPSDQGKGALAAGRTPSASQGKDEASTQPGPAIPPVSGATVGSGTGSGNQLSSVHISLPKDGQFGVVVVGASIQDKYPETAELWSGRMAATVYLRVGLAKSWILQYALPRLLDAASAGGGGPLEAPWPYEIVRPNIDLEAMDTDALIVHGFVNKDGRFEKLEVVFPPQFVQAPMVLNVLNQWHFRPARQNGIFTASEVLLVIPDQTQ